MTDITTLQNTVAANQAALQQANAAVFNANANLNSANYAEDGGTTLLQAQAELASTTSAQAAAQAQLTANQAALNDAQVATGAYLPDPNLAPASASSVFLKDPLTGSALANYSIPSTGILGMETISKVTDTGLQSTVSSITPAIKVVNANGNATAVSSSTGATIANMGAVSTGNTLPANTLPVTGADNTALYKVILTQAPTLSGLNSVTFDVMPTIAESGDAQYTEFSPIQHPGEILKYKGSSSRTWNVTAKLISRTAQEATDNLNKLNLIRSWRMPFYGTGTGAGSAGQYLGAPPPILTFKAYGDKAIGPVPTVLTSYSWSWTDDVDYIPNNSGQPFPVIIDVSLTLKESYSPAEYTRFDIIAYRNGNLPAAFSGTITSQTSATGTPTLSSISPSAIKTSSATSISTSQAQAASPTVNFMASQASAGNNTLTQQQIQGTDLVANLFKDSAI